MSENGEENGKNDFNGIVADLPTNSTTMITVF
jgi:hypothetical protein